MDEHRAKTPTNGGMNLVSNYAPSFSLGLTQEDLVTVVSNPLQLKKSGISKEIMLKLRNDQGMPLAIQVWLYECCSNVPSKIASKVDSWIPQLLNWNTNAPQPRFEFLMYAMFKGGSKVVFKNIEPTQMKLAKLQIPQKDAIQYERLVDSGDDFQDPPPKKINEHSKKKQKVDSSTPATKKLLRKKRVNIVDEHTQTRTPAHHAAKAAGMKIPVFKSISTRQVQSKQHSHVEEVAVSKPESHVEKEAFISKKVFDVFRNEMDYTGAETSLQRFNPAVVQNLGENQDGTKITDEKMDEINLYDSQFIISDELLLSLNAYRRESITTHPSATHEEEPNNEHFNDKKSESVVQVHCQENVDHYKRGKSAIPMMYFGVETVEDKNWFYTMGFPDQSIHDIYSVDDPNLAAGEQEAHLNEYINGFRMHATVPWHIVENIYIPVNIKGKRHWVLEVLSFSKRSIFLYVSYELSGHYPAVFAKIKKLVEIIPLCLQGCDFYNKKGINLQNHPSYKDKDYSDLFDVLFEEKLPQQLRGSL
ncbi:hypothetical protein FXO37_35077 [Capsicum annuum]|nr:hypothetical protein FXO37_35077 [Capsicum annuum]